MNFFSFRLKRPTITLALRSPALSEPMAGLVPITVDLEARAPLAGARLRLQAQGRTVYEKPLDLQPGRHELGLTLHGHLLPDGAAVVAAQILDAEGARLAQARAGLQISNRGPLAEAVRRSLAAAQVPLVIDGPCDSGFYDYADEALRPWFERSPEAIAAHLDGLRASGAADEATCEALRRFAEDGFLVLENLVEPDLVAQVNQDIDAAVAARHEGYEWGSSQRMHDLHARYPAMRRLWLHPKILAVLDLIFGVPSRPCQSLTYAFGSQQDAHQDTIHLTPFPAGYMCGVWTALEDVAEGSGELEVYPGSHRLPRIYARTAGIAKVDGDWREFGQKVVPRWRDMIAEAGIEPFVYRPKAGTVLIWHENLMHAGSVRRDPSISRRSMVAHHFAEGAIAYYDSSGAAGSMYLGPRAA